MTLSQPHSRRFPIQGRNLSVSYFAAHRIIRTSLTTIGLTAIVLAALAGGRAHSADTDLQPALQQIRDEVRDLRHDVKALRELLEKQSPPAVPSPAVPGPNVAKQPDITASIGDGVYYVYSRTDALAWLMTDMIDHLRGQGYPITKIDLLEDFRQKYGVDNLITVHPLLILKRGGKSDVLRGLQPEDTVRAKVTAYFAERTTSREQPSPASEPKSEGPSPEAYFFYAKWSGPDRLMMPLIDKLQGEGHRIVKVDVDTEQELAKRFNVTVVPTLCIESSGAFQKPLVGLQTEETIRAALSRKGAAAPTPGAAGSLVVDPAITGLPDRKVVQIKNYVESFAGDSGAALGRKMTGNEMIASVDGQSVFASEIFQRAGAEPLTPDGMSLAQATKALAAGQIAERYYRELQQLALRKFAPDFLKTRGWAQAMIASLGKAERAIVEERITKAFNTYAEKLKKDFNVATVFDVDKKLREQGTSLLAVKAQFRDRLLADEFIHGLAKKLAEQPAEIPQSGNAGDDLDRRVTIDCDERPLSEVLDKIFRDQPIIDIYNHPFGTFKYPVVRPIVRYLPAIQNETQAGRHFMTVPEYLDAKCPKRITLHVKDVSVAVALQRVFEQTPLDYWFENGVLRVDFPADKRLHQGLLRKVTVDCDRLPLRKFIRRIENDWRLGEVVISGAVDLEAPITLHLADATVATVLKDGCRQGHLSWQFINGRLDLSPVVDATKEEQRFHELIGKWLAEPEGKLITEIVIEGNATIPLSAILKKLKVTAGHKASARAIEEDVRTLWMTGWFNTVETRFRHKERGAGDVLVFVVFERAGIRQSQGNGNPPKKGEVGNVPPRTGVLDIPLIISPEEGLVAAPKDPMVLLCFPVADLLAAAGAGRKEKYDFDSLEKLIRTVVGPGFWEGTGGRGRIQHDSKSLTLVIQQTQSVHDQIRDLMQKLRTPQPFKFTLQPTVLRNSSNLLDRGPAAMGSAEHQPTVLLTNEECERIMKEHGGDLLPIPGAASSVGIDFVWQPFPGEPIWPEKIQAISGQIGGRAYIWFELTGKDPGTGEPHREGLMSLSPDFKPVLIPLRLLPSQKHKEWPLGPQRTVDEWAKSPDREFLLIRPVIQYTEAALDHRAAKEHDPAKAPQKK